MFFNSLPKAEPVVKIESPDPVIARIDSQLSELAPIFKEGGPTLQSAAYAEINHLLDQRIERTVELGVLALERFTYEGNL